MRARADARHGTPLETVVDGKRRRLVRAAEIYLHVKKQSTRACRFDVVAIAGSGAGETIEHVEDAFGYFVTFGQVGVGFCFGSHENGMIVPPSGSTFTPSTRSPLQMQSFLQQKGPACVATAQAKPSLQ